MTDNGRVSQPSRIHRWMYSLLYPAFLGTAIVGLLNTEETGARLYWGILLACYFTAQHGEGTFLEFNYPRSRVVQDLLEIVALAVAFSALGVLPNKVMPGWMATSPIVAVAAVCVAFILPPLFRQGIRREGWSGVVQTTAGPKTTHFNTILTILSAIAIAAVLLWGISMTSVVITGLIFLVYVSAFVLENDNLKSRFPWLARPT
ncbi:MAG TPA: hypothetical protein VFZ91_02090 [Allosphingosinicella sp.]